MTPCLAAIKSWRPDIETEVLMEPLSAPLLEDHPLVDRLIVARSSFAARARLVSELRSRNYDVAFNLHGGTTGMTLARLSGARHTVAFEGHRQSWMMTARAPAPDVILDRKRIHSVEQQLALLHWTGVPWPERPKLGLIVSPGDLSNMRERLKANEINTHDFAIISPAAAMDSKRWRADGFASVADHLLEKWRLQSVVIAGPGQEHIADEVSGISRSKAPVFSKMTLKELIALASLSRVFIGNDSGPAHIAAAIHRPVVVIFGSSNPDVWHPWTETPYRVIKTTETKEASSKHNLDSSQTGPISFILNESVIAAAEEVLQEAALADEKEIKVKS